jgi:excisionase family DNA binding protein
MTKYSEIQNPRLEIPRREIMTPREAAEYLSIHVRTIYRLAKNGEIPGRKVGGSWRFKKDALDDWLSWRDNAFAKVKG